MDNADFDRFLTEIDCDDALAETRTMAETRLSRRRLLGASLAGAAGSCSGVRVLRALQEACLLLMSTS